MSYCFCTLGNHSSLEDRTTYSFHPFEASSSTDAAEHIGYGLVLKCVSEEDSDLDCISKDAHSVSVPNSGASHSNSSPEITFIVQPSSSATTTSDKSYAWGSIMSQAFSKFLQSYST